ncbi:hypothetical protein [Thalassotalea fusca]
MKRLIENYISQTFGPGLMADLKLLLGEKINVFNMLNRETLWLPEGEVNFRKKRALRSLKKVGQRLNGTANTQSMHDQSKEKWLTPKSNVMFVNGIVTSIDLAEHQAMVLAKAIRQPVTLVHNETEGLVKDLLECNEGRYGVMNAITQKVATVISEKLCDPLAEDNSKLNIVAYSQGAIIVTAALHHLSQQLPAQQLARIAYFTFGAGFRESVLPACIYCEHFANSDDPITKLGVQHPDFPYSGELFVRQAKGHFFIADYLIPMQQGVQYGDSVFERMVVRAPQ